ncbi:MAG TPA: RNB domain-containing ribonuclease [Pyrinomonadaceae bacterium]
MTKTNAHQSLDLRAMARRAMIENGFEPDMPPEVEHELQASGSEEPTAPDDPGVRDMRSVLWSSIDNHDSRDLDQVEFAERMPNGDIRLMIGIADVDAFVHKGSAIDRHALHNTTSIYTGVRTFPMLPEQLSNHITSLLEDVERLSVVIELVVDAEGEVTSTEVYRARVRNHAKLVYERIGAWLEGHTPVPPEVSKVAGLEEQLRLQDEATERLRALRKRNGALNLQTIEAKAVAVDGRVVDLVASEHNRARDIIESFMVAANTEMAQFLEAEGLPSIRRVVRTPERWPRIVEIARGFGDNLPEEPDSRALAAFLTRRRAADPVHFPDLSLSIVKLMGPGEYVVEGAGAEGDGHFGLAVHDYTHSTAPNRRYPDLITQRLLKAVIARRPAPYTQAELREIAEHCTEREDAARKVERLMRKASAAVLLGERIGETFDAIVTGVSNKGTFVRLIAPPAEGRVMRGEEGMDVGDKVRVKLLSTEPERGFIDFARAR